MDKAADLDETYIPHVKARLGQTPAMNLDHKQQELMPSRKRQDKGLLC